MSETAFERWKNNELSDTERLLLYLQSKVGEMICLRHLRKVLGFENIRGRITTLYHNGYDIDGAECLPLCSCDGSSIWSCSGSQLYRLNSENPVRPVRRKLHGGVWVRTNWDEPMVVLHTTNIDNSLTDVERQLIAKYVEAAIYAAEIEIAHRRETVISDADGESED